MSKNRIDTVDDLIETLEECKKRYPEFGKYIVCVNVILKFYMVLKI